MIQVERNGIVSNSFIQTVAPTAPGVFLANAAGDAAMYDNTRQTYNSPSTPAAKGDIVTIYGTGAGLITPLPGNGSVTSLNPANFGTVNAPITVRVGGVPLPASDVLYAGPAPGLITGVFQVNFRVPSFIRDPKVPVGVAIGTGSPDIVPVGSGYMYVQVP